jgi:DNA end-binding protein Ku
LLAGTANLSNHRARSFAAPMASRPVWEGHLRLSLVTCPVALHKATQESRGAVRFHLLNPETHNRVKQAWKDAAEDTELDRRDLVRGYEVEKDTYVVVEEGELKALKLESTKVIDIEKFVEARAIDRLYWDQPYYLVPDGKPAAEPYAVIREAMQKEGQVALGRLVMASRERVVAIEVRQKGMLLTTLRSREEVREAAELFDAIPEVRISPRMVEIAKQIIAQAGRVRPRRVPRPLRGGAARAGGAEGRRGQARAPAGGAARSQQRHRPDGRAAPQPQGRPPRRRQRRRHRAARGRGGRTQGGVARRRQARPPERARPRRIGGRDGGGEEDGAGGGAPSGRRRPARRGAAACRPRRLTPLSGSGWAPPGTARPAGSPSSSCATRRAARACPARCAGGCGPAAAAGPRG